MWRPRDPRDRFRTRFDAAVAGCGLLLLFLSNSAAADGPAFGVSSSQVDGQRGTCHTVSRASRRGDWLPPAIRAGR